MRYIDGYVVVVAKKKLAAYRKIARAACKVWMDHGAIQYVECAGDDMTVKCGVPFPRLMKLKKTETAVFAWVAYKSRAHRDRVNAAVMKDPRIAKMMAGGPMPFDMNRMTYGGFQSMVDA